MPRPQNAGESNPAAILTEQDVQRIRDLYATGLIRQRELTLAFGVSHGTIQAIVQGRRWRQGRTPTPHDGAAG